MISEAIKDASDRGDLVLDSFAGSGTLLLAAEQAGRRARLIELDPYYCDLIIGRAEAIGLEAHLDSTGASCIQVGAERRSIRNELHERAPEDVA